MAKRLERQNRDSATIPDRQAAGFGLSLSRCRRERFAEERQVASKISQ
jgi:hypothetical protein